MSKEDNILDMINARRHFRELSRARLIQLMRKNDDDFEDKAPKYVRKYLPAFAVMYAVNDNDYDNIIDYDEDDEYPRNISRRVVRDFLKECRTYRGDDIIEFIFADLSRSAELFTVNQYVYDYGSGFDDVRDYIWKSAGEIEKELEKEKKLAGIMSDAVSLSTVFRSRRVHPQIDQLLYTDGPAHTILSMVAPIGAKTRKRVINTIATTY